MIYFAVLIVEGVKTRFFEHVFAGRDLCDADLVSHLITATRGSR